MQKIFLVSWDYSLACETKFFLLLGSLEVDSFFRRIVEEFDGLGDRSNALPTWLFVSALRCIALRYTVSSVPFREIVRRFGPFRSVPVRFGPFLSVK